jgi:hypothetical protein
MRARTGLSLAGNDLKPWRKDMWCIPQVDAEYVARMEDVLELYAEPRDLERRAYPKPGAKSARLKDSNPP